MKSFIVFAFCVAVAVAAPPSFNGDPKTAEVVKQESNNIGVGPYEFAYDTSNGISQSEQGQLINAGAENEALTVRGQFSYPGPDGVVYTITYTADENGYHPEGAHLPKNP